MRKLRIGILGCADIARRMVIPSILELPDFFELVAIASRTEAKALEFSNLFNLDYEIGYDNLLNRDDIEVIYMPLPTGLHVEWVRKALCAGKHVLVEKSLALNFQDATEMVSAARDNQLILMENFMFCYHSQHQWVKQKLADDSIGEIRLFQSQFGFPPLSSDNFRYDINVGGGALLDAGAYTVKASQFFLGNDLEFLNAVLYIDPNRGGVDLFGNASLINNKGIVAQLSFGFDNYYQCNYEFWGNSGKLRSEKAFTPKPIECPTMLFEKQGKSERVTMVADNHFASLLKQLYHSIITNNYGSLLDEILVQSKILTDIKEKAYKVIL